MILEGKQSQPHVTEDEVLCQEVHEFKQLKAEKKQNKIRIGDTTLSSLLNYDIKCKLKEYTSRLIGCNPNRSHGCLHILVTVKEIRLQAAMRWRVMCIVKYAPFALYHNDI